MPLFSRFKNKGSQPAAKDKAQAGSTNGQPPAPRKPRWETAWNSKTVEPAEVQDLIRTCTQEMKSRAEALDTPFLLLPFRPHTDPSSARTFIQNFYKSNSEGSYQYRGAGLQQELHLTDSAVLCSIIKWCWSRMPGGVVTWPVYEGFQIGEKESNMARNAFETFITIGAGSEARMNIITDFFDLLAAVAAHGKMNGLGGRKLSRLAGWWAFEHSDDGKGFEGGYKSWAAAADASSHLFFAYLRSCSPEEGQGPMLIERIPRSLQALLASTEYPPETPTLLQRSTPRVVMLVDQVSPTPFALLRRAKHFEYRDNDRVLREYSEFENPVDALTDECKRVLYAISSTNSAAALSRHGNTRKTGQETWSAFQNMGFSDLDQNAVQKQAKGVAGSSNPAGHGLRSQSRLRGADQGARPTTPSWADFLSSGFYEDVVAKTPTTLSLPSDKVLPPIGSREHTPHTLHGGDDKLAPGEMAAIANVDLDDAFWWVWMTSLASEEYAERKSVFGRCALIETTVMNGRWLIIEEQVKGASPDPTEGVYIAPKKSRFGFTKRGKNKNRDTRKPSPAPNEPLERIKSATPSKSSLAPAQTSKIRQAAAELARKQTNDGTDTAQRRGRYDDAASTKTTSMLTMGIMTEASPAMKWASAYDKNAIRSQYLGDQFAGKGMSRENLLANRASSVFLANDAASATGPSAPALSRGQGIFPSDDRQNRELPALPKDEAPAVGGAEAHFDDKGTPPQGTEHAVQPMATMLPRAPQVNILRADAEEKQHDAEGLPLPETTPAQPTSAMDKEVGASVPTSSSTRLGRKPVPRSDTQRHPAFRQPTAEESAQQESPAPAPTVSAEPQHAPQSLHSTQDPAVLAARKALEGSSSPESLQKQSQGRLKKQSGNGLKKLFGRKKDNPDRKSVEVPRPGSKRLEPPSGPNLGRRLSLMRKNPGQMSGLNASQVAVARPSPETVQEPIMPDSHGQFENSMADISHVDSRSEPNAEEEFSRFDQGPMEDMPSAVPHNENLDDYEGLHAPAPQRHFNTQLASRIAPDRIETDNAASDPPIGHGTPADDAQSEATLGEPAQQERNDVAPAEDRWAKIRENAAKRAARASEEQSTQSRPSQSMRGTDDGETSGEETIESRVARIKARVAELTGNIDSGSGAAARR